MPNSLNLTPNETTRLRNILAKDDVNGLRIFIRDVASTHKVEEREWPFWSSVDFASGAKRPLMPMMGATSVENRFKLTPIGQKSRDVT